MPFPDSSELKLDVSIPIFMLGLPAYQINIIFSCINVLIMIRYYKIFSLNLFLLPLYTRELR